MRARADEERSYTVRLDALGAARDFVEWRPPFGRVVAAPPPPLLRARLGAVDGVREIRRVGVRVVRDRRHHRRDDLMIIDHVAVGELGLARGEPVEPELVVLPR